MGIACGLRRSFGRKRLAFGRAASAIRPPAVATTAAARNAQITAVAVDHREERHSDGGDAEGAGERHTHSAVVDQAASGVGAGSGGERERDEGEPGRKRPCAEDVLQIERAEQDRSVSRGEPSGSGRRRLRGRRAA
jgi:hypothetical protein